jgi:hypothetical protein
MRSPNSAIEMRESFEHFYLTKVGLGEGCGCAEHVTRIREIETYAANRARRSGPTNIVPPVFALLARLFRRRAKEA